jgi:hypothetical protein
MLTNSRHQIVQGMNPKWCVLRHISQLRSCMTNFAVPRPTTPRILISSHASGGRFAFTTRLRACTVQSGVVLCYHRESGLLRLRQSAALPPSAQPSFPPTTKNEVCLGLSPGPGSTRSSAPHAHFHHPRAIYGRRRPLVRQ